MPALFSKNGVIGNNGEVADNADFAGISLEGSASLDEGIGDQSIESFGFNMPILIDDQKMNLARGFILAVQIRRIYIGPRFQFRSHSNSPHTRCRRIDTKAMAESWHRRLRQHRRPFCSEEARLTDVTPLPRRRLADCAARLHGQLVCAHLAIVVSHQAKATL
jgi:hypothetical protein